MKFFFETFARESDQIKSGELPTGAYTLNAKRGESSGSEVFTIGLTKGSGAISIQTTRDEYKPGEQMLNQYRTKLIEKHIF